MYCRFREGITRQQGLRSLLYRRSSASVSSLCSTSYISHASPSFSSRTPKSKSMAASTSKSVLRGVCVDDISTSCSNTLDFKKPGAGCFVDRTRKGYLNNALNTRYSTLDTISSFPHRPWLKNFSATFCTSFFARAAHNVSFDRSACDEQLENSTPTVAPTVDGGETLKLFSGSCYLPHPDKEETGGEDAHFICTDEQAFGVADGVGGWAEVGVNAGLFSRELMSNSVRAIQDEPKGSINPARVLEKAHSSARAKGSSTACIIALAEKELHAINLGDSGFIVVRDGSTIFKSPIQQHGFNFTYQLESGDGGDLPSSGEVFTVPVAGGDVVIAGTDGLFDNLYNNEITAVVVHAVRTGLEPQVTAQKIAALARQRALDKNRQTPFSAAAQEAGFRYYGGKLDDITVVVSYITSANS
ncbi:probable protein phosphatase 2C 80 isoform X1 [Neltuma alba]|uniref:probable protein phosphatase 2C 80 isoform X1 n=1 Tax=Neltuma alba TaxID=207710 RepID=UPI0010A43297|nr:probable protein phosphatase 2C 80 isoform X1 [Prosopis alba]XP_028760410.1 probable protein phosphatase 2C 80 isoform X1 [Prosopis alba]XP_028760411.1 probable protein phosphatase 2C 80 isoform X1 [Prosopis alba]XP_028781909.1 probable protein phosphatase 2C 80 isoform X1 [Prosopis alba]